MVRVEGLDATIASLASENDALKTSLVQSEQRLSEMYADQARMEDEMAARLDVADKLRAQIRELEKEKRDSHRRYNEQVCW